MIARYRYWNKIRNLGDAITAPIIADRLGLVPVVVPAHEPHLLATGSILFMANAKSFVWGSGIMDPAMALDRISPTQVRAVRGAETLKLLRAGLKGLGEVALGDPGIFADSLVPTRDQASARYRAAVVPHHVSFARKSFDRFRDDPDHALVDMRDASLAPLEAIAASELVISQSLHGLIFATALGKPNVWVSHNFDERWTFKFRDWFSTVENPQAAPLPLTAPFAELRAAAELRPSAIDRAALLAAFPQEVRAVQAGPILDFGSVRAMGLAALACDWADLTGDATRWHERDAAALDALAQQIRLVTRRHCAGWAETPYLLLVPRGVAVGQAAREELIRFMDSHAHIEGLIVARGAPPAEQPAYAGATLDVFRGRHANEGALLVRPHIPFSFARAIDTCLLRGTTSAG